MVRPWSSDRNVVETTSCPSDLLNVYRHNPGSTCSSAFALLFCACAHCKEGGLPITFVMKSYDSVMLEYICTDDNDPLLLKSVGGCSASASCKSTVDINCEVYGHFKITEVCTFASTRDTANGSRLIGLHKQPALVDLIESPAVQRLKGVFQVSLSCPYTFADRRAKADQFGI